MKNIIKHFHIKFKRNSFNKILSKIFLVAISFIVVPILILGMWFYSNWKKEQMKTFVSQNINRLDHISLTIEESLSMIDSEVLVMINSSNFYNFKRMTKPGEYVNELRIISDRLNDAYIGYPYLQSIYFYDPRYEYIVTNYSTYDFEEFYDTDWLNQMDDLNQIYRLAPRTNINKDIDDGAILSIHKPEPVITIAANGVYDIKIAANISIADYYNYLNQLYRFIDEEFFVIDTNGNIIVAKDTARIGKPINIDFSNQHGNMLINNDYLYLINNMDSDALRCVIKIPLLQLNQSYAYFRNYIISICLLLAILAVVGTIYITLHIYSPVKELFSSIHSLCVSDNSKDEALIQDELSYIKELYQNMALNCKDMENSLSVYKRSMQIYRLKDYFDDIIPFHKVLEILDLDIIDLEHEPIQLVFYSVPEAELTSNINAELVNINEIINTYIAKTSKGLFFDIGPNIFLALIPESKINNIDNVRHIISRLLSEMLEKSVYVGTSAITDSNDLKKGYKQGLAACNYAMFFEKKDHIIFSQEINDSNFDYSLVINYETQILRSALSYEY